MRYGRGLRYTFVISKSDCSVIYVRNQREKHVGRVKAHLKTESGCRDVDLHPDAAAFLRNFIGNR